MTQEGKREAERFYSRATKEFDRWFYSLPRAQQDELRAKDVLPYREQLVPMHVIEYDTNRPNMIFDSANDSANDETFYSREKVEEFTRRLLETLEYSHSPEVRLHFQLVRIALRDHRAMSGETLAKLYGMTRAGINFRVQRIRGIMTGQTPSKACQDGREKKRDAQKRAEKKASTSKTSPKKTESGRTPGKESLGRGVPARVAPHPGKKTRKNPRFSRGC